MKPKVPKAKKSHDGGIVPGFRGQEVPMILLAGQRVLPPGQRSGGGGGNNYYITLNALDSSDGGAKLIKMLDDYERANGRRYARA